MLKKSYPWGLAMLQPKALPGSYLHKDLTLDNIVEGVLEEAKLLSKMGYDGFIVQNMHDGVAGQHANVETIAFMTALVNEIRRNYESLLLGVLVNWDGVASLAVAEATKADFVRIEHEYVGVSITKTGFFTGQCAEVCAFRKRLNSKIPVFADAMEVNSSYLGGKTKVETAVDIVKRAYADGIFVSEKTVEESKKTVSEIRKHLTENPIFLGGGATGENIRDLIQIYDGVSVSTWIKNGDMKNPIDVERAKRFINELNIGRELRN